jgi:NAD(P)-dependent dehydrogenase (short-subunit alcohol dehydrogenase family)
MLVKGRAGISSTRPLTDAAKGANFVNMSADASPPPVCLVTGGAGGIGAAIARRLVGAGAVVVVADRDEAGARRVAEELGNGATARPGRGIAGAPSCPGDGIGDADARQPDALASVPAGSAEARALDVGDAAAVGALVDEVVTRHGRLDCACNCAGVTGVRADTGDYPEAVFRRVLAVNAEGVFACMRAELRAMERRGAGAIVNIASGAATLGVAGSAAYVASKHAVAGLTRTAAIEYAARGIAVNAVSPGLVLTGAVDLDTDRFVAAHPSGRPVAAEEVAAVVAWLLLEAPRQLTGALIPVDGGLTAQVAGAGA